MIRLIGSAESPEGEAAKALLSSIVKLWPDIAPSQDEKVNIAIGAKVFGSAVQDLDIVICLVTNHRNFQPLRPVTCRPNDVVVTKNIRVYSFVAVVEVKGHDQRSVRFDGNNAMVLYKQRWHDASQQSLSQAHALRQYLETTSGHKVFVANLIYFPNLEESDLPTRPHNFIAGDIGGRALMSCIADVARPYMTGGGIAVMSAGNEQSMSAVVFSRLFQTVAPSPLDRVRMERVSRRLGLDDRWFSGIGEKQVIFRGRAGTGKTVALLQIANRLFEERGARTLLLTYNLALVADIRRLTTLLNIPAGGEHGGIRTESAMGFIGAVMSQLDMLDRSRPLLEQYNLVAAFLAESLMRQATSDSEIRAALERNPERFAFDYVMVDEAQDWPTEEISILRACVPSNKLVVADGLDQLVRGDRTSWTAGVPMAQQQIWPLKSALRLKSNLAFFANEAALKLGVEGWRIEPRSEVSGGRVLVVKGKVSPSLRNQVLQQAIDDNNRLIDVLLCVPPSLALIKHGSTETVIGEALSEEGIKCWDGTKRDIRLDIPRSLDEVRVIQYESCRGLEGWSVLCLGLSEFVSQKRQEGSELVHRWLLMALTRAIDTLVIEVSRDDEFLNRLFDEMADALPDFVEVIDEASGG